jgi:hypothetical protein
VPGSIDYVLWLLTALCEASVLLCAVTRNSVRRYLALNVYMFVSLVVTIIRFWIFSHYGFSSSQYFYFYYYSDALLTIGLYFGLIALYAHVLDELQVGRYVRLASTLLLAGTAFFSYLVVQQSGPRLLTRYVVEMSQNLYFVGVVLTYILWGAILKLREMRSRVIQLVLSLGVYFSAFAGNYALRNLYPQLHFVWEYVPPVLACLLPLSWAYAFWRIPEDARLVPSRLAAVVPR